MDELDNAKNGELEAETGNSSESEREEKTAAGESVPARDADDGVEPASETHLDEGTEAPEAPEAAGKGQTSSDEEVGQNADLSAAENVGERTIDEPTAEEIAVMVAAGWSTRKLRARLTVLPRA